MTAANRCTGCVNIDSDSQYRWACMECKRWWPDKYEKREENADKQRSDREGKKHGTD